MSRRFPKSWSIAAGIAAGLLLPIALPAQGQEDKLLARLPEGPGREETFYLCNACHSIRLVTQQRMTRKGWDKTLVWMVEEQGMPELESDERALILDYLDTHFDRDVPR